MAKICVQIGHVNGLAGAAHEEETLKLIVPHVVERLCSAGHQVVLLDGSLENEDANYQHQFDGCLFCHCDADGNASTFSIGYWEEVHPGSQALAVILRSVYELETGIRFNNFNITVGEAHYYGNRRIAHSCKCNLIEFGFVSNPVQRAFLQNNPKRIGYAAANAYIRYFGGKPEPPPAKIEEEKDMYEQQLNTKEFVRLDCWRDEFNYFVTTDGNAKNLRFKLDGKQGGSGTTDPQDKDGLVDHNLQDILKQERMKAVKGSFKLTVMSDKDINIGLREVAK